MTVPWGRLKVHYISVNEAGGMENDDTFGVTYQEMGNSLKGS